MSGDFPIVKGFQVAVPSSREFNVRSFARSGRLLVGQVGEQKWELTWRSPAMLQAEILPVMAFLVQQGGGRESFTIGLGSFGANLGSAEGAMVTSGAATAGDSSVGVTGFTGSLPAGQLVTFAGQAKVYMLTADLSGPGAATIYPPLIEDVGSGEGVTYSDVKMTVRQVRDVQEFPAERGGKKYRYELDLIEEY